jgi:hypothetical protein
MSEKFLPPTSFIIKKWTGMGLLILGGFLLIPILVTHWANGWACFITLPAVLLFCLGCALAERSGRFHTGSRFIIAVSLVIAAVALIFLLELSWNIFWPVMIIVPTAGLLAISVPFKHHWVASLYQEWLFYFSIAGLLLGIEFLLGNLRILPIYATSLSWWGLNICVVFAGGLIITLRLFLAKRPLLAVLSNLMLTLCMGFTGVISTYSLNWNLLTPLFLLSLGFLLLASSLFPESLEKKVF